MRFQCTMMNSDYSSRHLLLCTGPSRTAVRRTAVDSQTFPLQITAKTHKIRLISGYLSKFFWSSGLRNRCALCSDLADLGLARRYDLTGWSDNVRIVSGCPSKAARRRSSLSAIFFCRFCRVETRFCLWTPSTAKKVNITKTLNFRF